MTPDTFSWWLHGWSEINGGAAPSTGQWRIITDHLNLAFGEPILAGSFGLNGSGSYNRVSAEAILAKATSPIDVRYSVNAPHIQPLLGLFVNSGC